MWLLSVNINILTRRKARINNYISCSYLPKETKLSKGREDWVTQGDENGVLRIQTQADMAFNIPEYFAGRISGEIVA